MALLSKEQFTHICGMLKAHGREVTKENISWYLKNNPSQMKKFTNRAKNKKQDFELKQRAYLQNLLFRVKIFGRWFIMYKFGIKHRYFWGFEYLKKRV